MTVRGGDTVDAVLRVGDMFGSETWTRAVWIVNREAGRGSRYPKKFPALIFALQGMLWMYTPLDGTQSLSQYRGRLAIDQQNLNPLLAAVEPGLKILAELQRSAVPTDAQTPPPFACFPRCVARWFEMQRDEEPPDDARLLNYYMPSRSGQKGHTVLEYRRGDERFVYDPDRADELPSISASVADPLEIVQKLALRRAMRAPSKVMALSLTAREGGDPVPKIAVRREPGAGSNRSSFMR